MAKPTLLYASPFPPQQTGIADYSEAMALELRRYFDVTLYTADYELKNGELRAGKVLKHGIDCIDLGRFDVRMYHIGNNPWFHSYIYEACLRHPGVVFLHEPLIFYLVMGHYQSQPDFYSRLYEIGGPEIIAAVKDAKRAGLPLMRLPDPQRFPLNRELLYSGNRFFVHSDYARLHVEQNGPAGIRVQRVDLADVAPFEPGNDGNAIRERFGIPRDATLICSFGAIAPVKLNRQVCQAVKRVNYKSAKPIYYLMAGEGDYADDYLDPYIKKSGWIDEAYADYYYAPDLILNLRYPTMGETSAALLRAMRAAKPCVVTDVGWFSELPAGVAIKLPADCPENLTDRIYDTLMRFQADRQAFAGIGATAGVYAARVHDVEEVGRQIAAALL